MSAIRPISDLQFGVANTEIGVIQAPEPGPRIMRYELTDFEWTAIRPFLPNKPRGVPRVNDRRVLNGIFWILRSGAPWRDLPDRAFPSPRRRRQKWTWQKWTWHISREIARAIVEDRLKELRKSSYGELAEKYFKELPTWLPDAELTGSTRLGISGHDYIIIGKGPANMASNRQVSMRSTPPIVIGVSLVIAAVAWVAPFAAPMVWSYWASGIWCVFVIGAIAVHGKRELWSLLGAPVAL